MSKINKIELDNLVEGLQEVINQVDYICKKYNIKTKKDVEEIFQFVDDVRTLNKYFVIDWKENKQLSY